MPTTDAVSRLVADLAAAFGLLTRLPVGALALPPRTAGVWAWPVAGAAVGALSALGVSAALWLGLPSGVAAATALAVSACVTGALHEDGLADTADGLFGGWTKARRLAIMKDSHIGSYGTLALLIVTLARWSALVAVIGAGAHWPVLVAVGALSRAPMAMLMAALPNARGSGLAQSVGRPTVGAATMALAVACGIAGLLTGSAVVPMLGLTLVGTLALGLVARARIGGQTGDILGASQQLAEAAALGMAAAALA